jgi:hypothetical protein
MTPQLGSNHLEYFGKDIVVYDKSALPGSFLNIRKEGWNLHVQIPFFTNLSNTG